MGEVKNNSSLVYSSSPYTVATASKVRGVDCFAREIGGKILHLLLSDVEEAERRIVKNVQNQTFPEELSSPNMSKSPLAKLKPFVNDGVLRVGGRLDRADLSYDAKHPMKLPGKYRVTEMIILQCHFANGHVGPYQPLAETRSLVHQTCPPANKPGYKKSFVSSN